MNSEELHKLETTLWAAADKLRSESNLKSSQYSTPLLGLIFLRFASIRYDKFRAEIESEYERLKGGRNEKSIESIALEKCGYYIPPKSHYDFLLSLPESEDIPKRIKEAMEGIEQYKPELVGSLPKDEYYNLEPMIDGNEDEAHDYSLTASLLKTINQIPADIDGDLFGKVYEYFLGKFASSEGKGGGEYYTPTSVVRLMVEMIEPYHGRILDPACGSGGMFVQSADFVKRCSGRGDDIRVYGIEKEIETVKLARMNMFLHGLSSDIRQANSYYNDPHNCFGQFDFIMANPPFNVDDVNYDKVKDDRRFNTYGIPKNKTKSGKKNDKETVPNANYLWINLFATSLNENGRAALVMANSASDAGKSEFDIRKKLIESGVIHAMLSLPSNMFFNVTLPATLWFFDNARTDDKRVLFVNAQGIFRQIDRAHRDFTDEHIANINVIRQLYEGKAEEYQKLVTHYANRIETLTGDLAKCTADKAKVEAEVAEYTEANPQKKLKNELKRRLDAAIEAEKKAQSELVYMRSMMQWLRTNFPDGEYRDVIGLCKAADLNEIDAKGWTLNPGAYVGVVAKEEDDMEFAERMKQIHTELISLQEESNELLNQISFNFKELGL